MTAGRVPYAPSWDERLGAVEDARPTMTLWWAEFVTDAFGGRVHQERVTARGLDVEMHAVVGGRLAADSFVVGHIGHGAVRRAADLGPVPLSGQVAAVRRLQQILGRPCGRLVTGPSRSEPPEPYTGASVRCTRVLDLASSVEGAQASVSGAVRTAVRACIKAGYEVVLLGPSDTQEAVVLVQATQARVGSPYRTPAGLLAELLHAPRKRARVYGVFVGKRLVAVSFFLCWGGHLAYMFNGYERVRGRPSPNYLAVWAAMVEAGRDGFVTLDLGYSSAPALARHKAQWGGRLEYYSVLGGEQWRTGTGGQRVTT